MMSLGSGWPSVNVEGVRDISSTTTGVWTEFEGSADFLDMVTISRYEGKGESEVAIQNEMRAFS